MWIKLLALVAGLSYSSDAGALGSFPRVCGRMWFAAGETKATFLSRPGLEFASRQGRMRLWQG